MFISTYAGIATHKRSPQNYETQDLCTKAGTLANPSLQRQDPLECKQILSNEGEGKAFTLACKQMALGMIIL